MSVLLSFRADGREVVVNENGGSNDLALGWRLTSHARRTLSASSRAVRRQHLRQQHHRRQQRTQDQIKMSAVVTSAPLTSRTGTIYLAYHRISEHANSQSLRLP